MLLSQNSNWIHLNLGWPGLEAAWRRISFPWWEIEVSPQQWENWILTTLWYFKSLLWGISSGFPLADYLALLVLSLYLVCLRWIPVQRSVERLTLPTVGWHPLHFWPQRSLCAYTVGNFSLGSRMRNLWSLYLLSVQDSAPLCSCCYLYHRVSVHRGLTSAA